jgi:hypothetical protein
VKVNSEHAFAEKFNLSEGFRLRKFATLQAPENIAVKKTSSNLRGHSGLPGNLKCRVLEGLFLVFHRTAVVFKTTNERKLVIYKTPDLFGSPECKF